MEPRKNTAGSLELIVQAEKNAEAVRKSAVEAAKIMVADAGEKHSKRVADEIALAEEEKKHKLSEIGLEAERIIEKELKSARDDADRISVRSSKHMSDAVRAICWKMCGEP